MAGYGIIDYDGNKNACVSILGSVVYVHGATRLMGLSSLVHTQSGWIGYNNGRIYQFCQLVSGVCIMISGNHGLWLVAIKRGTVYTASEARVVWD